MTPKADYAPCEPCSKGAHKDCTGGCASLCCALAAEGYVVIRADDLRDLLNAHACAYCPHRPDLCRDEWWLAPLRALIHVVPGLRDGGRVTEQNSGEPFDSGGSQ